jgi:hypothetical protein
MIFAKRKSDNKEFLVTRMGFKSLEGVAKDGEKADLLKGKYDFYKK